MRIVRNLAFAAAMMVGMGSPAMMPQKSIIAPELIKEVSRKQADNRSFGGLGKKNYRSRSKYTGADLRAIRAVNGVGRPPEIMRKRMENI